MQLCRPCLLLQVDVAVSEHPSHHFTRAQFADDERVRIILSRSHEPVSHSQHRASLAQGTDSITNSAFVVAENIAVVAKQNLWPARTRGGMAASKSQVRANSDQAGLLVKDHAAPT